MPVRSRAEPRGGLLNAVSACDGAIIDAAMLSPDSKGQRCAAPDTFCQ